jgi:hypothetical protein
MGEAMTGISVWVGFIVAADIRMGEAMTGISVWVGFIVAADIRMGEAMTGIGVVGFIVAGDIRMGVRMTGIGPVGKDRNLTTGAPSAAGSHKPRVTNGPSRKSAIREMKLPMGSPRRGEMHM